MTRGAKKGAGVRGSALLMALVLLAVMSIGAGVAWRRLGANVERHFRAELGERARCTAEAGLDKAMAMLRAEGEGYEGEKDTPFDEGRFSVAVEVMGGGEYGLHAVGYVCDERVVFAEQRLEAVVRVSEKGEIEGYRVWEVRR